MIFKLFHQFETLFGFAALQFDIRGRQHGKFCVLALDPVIVECLTDTSELGRGGGHLIHTIISANVGGSSIECNE